MDDDKVITGYNPRTARRLLSYLKPHKRVVVVAVIALAFSTVGELLIPVIMQRGVDQHLMTERLRISVEDAGSADLDGVDLSRSVTIGDHLYVLENRLEGLSGARRTDLQERGLLSRRSYYVTDLSADEARQVVADNRNLFVRNEQYAAILFDELETFSDRERRALRHADIEGVTEKSGVFLIVLLGVLAFTFVQIYFMAVSGQRVMRDMRVQLFDHVIRQSLAFLNRNPVGRLVTRLTNDVETINELFTNVLIS
ncbi:MAG: ABC transporter transmembrane domain-containing protein, partial [Spirochaetota bacterium]